MLLRRMRTWARNGAAWAKKFPFLEATTGPGSFDLKCKYCSKNGEDISFNSLQRMQSSSFRKHAGCKLHEMSEAAALGITKEDVRRSAPPIESFEA
eukprot:1057245-Alexandrium_andersonii.AAC.1